ncbi:M48 family metalloprotease [Aurantivibrio plasticivorans]
MLQVLNIALRRFTPKPICLAIALSALLSTSVLPAYGADVDLPALGDSSAGLISPQQEYELGQKVLKLYRSQMPTSSDPIIYSYLEQLITSIAAHSDLPDKRFDLIVIDNPSINAFAVPGRIIGVHTGIFLETEKEDQLASILAHELAHLSQRHYARQVQAQQSSSLPTMAGLLAGIILAAAGSGDAGMAAIMATQAAALDSRLRFSRLHEQEADRVGIQTLAAAGRDPNAAADMFEVMLRDARFYRKPPEFLSTHPVTESRIADARARAMQFPQREYPDSVDFHLIAARAKLHHSESIQHAIKAFQSEVDGQSISQEASRYGLVLALTEAGKTQQAREELDNLLAKRPEKLIYTLASADVDAKEEDYKSALNKLNKLLKLYPSSHAVNIQFAETLMSAKEYELCEQLLVRYSRIRSDNDYVWYLLAEVHGLVGNIIEVHRARAEYFILNGIYQRAERQLQNAYRLVDNNTPTAALIEQRLIDVKQLQKEAKL